jgi:hypothetical protein
LGSMYCEPKSQHSPNQTQIWIIDTCRLLYLLVVLLNCSTVFHALWPLNSRLSCSKNQYLFDCHELWLWKVLYLTKKALGCIQTLQMYWNKFEQTVWIIYFNGSSKIASPIYFGLLISLDY